MTPLESTFVDVVAWEIAVRRNGGAEIENACYWCGKEITEPNAQCGTFTDMSYMKRCAPRSVEATPDDALLAAKLLGMLEERNGASIKEIVVSARDEADRKNPCLNCGHDDFHRTFAPVGCICGCTSPVFVVFDTPAFFRAIARESLGEGKVFDEYAEFGFPPSHFSVPRLNIEGVKA